MINRLPRTAYALLAGTALIALPTSAVTAQDAQAEGSASAALSGLDLPGDGTLRIGGDPNTRLPTATVNGRIITGTDVQQRIALFLSGSQQTPNAQQLAQLRDQTLRNLIDELIQIEEASAQEMGLTPSEVESTYARIATQNFNMSKEQFDEYLVRIGSSPTSFKRQIEGELAWQRLIGRNVEPFVNVSIEEVNEVIERLNASKGLDEYNIAEIYLASTPATNAQVQENAAALMQQIREGGNFQAYAAQYSDASTAASGGILGWVRPVQLPVEIATEVSTMAPSQIVGPIPLQGGGFSIIYLIDKRQVLTADPRDAVVSLKQMTITFDDGMTQTQAEQKLANFTAGADQLRGCGNAEEVGAQIGAEVRANDITIRDLPIPLQDPILQMQVGMVTSPFGSVEEGVSVLVLCGRDDPEAAAAPDPAALQAQIKDERVERRGERYLRDLRRDAVIEYN